MRQPQELGNRRWFISGEQTSQKAKLNFSEGPTPFAKLTEPCSLNKGLWSSSNANQSYGKVRRLKRCYEPHWLSPWSRRETAWHSDRGAKCANGSSGFKSRAGGIVWGCSTLTCKNVLMANCLLPTKWISSLTARRVKPWFLLDCLLQWLS